MSTMQLVVDEGNALKDSIGHLQMQNMAGSMAEALFS